MTITDVLISIPIALGLYFFLVFSGAFSHKMKEKVASKLFDDSDEVTNGKCEN